MDRKNERFRFFFDFYVFSDRIPPDVIVHDSSNKSNILFLLFIVYALRSTFVHSNSIFNAMGLQDVTTMIII